MGISNVKITGETEFDTKLAFGIQKDLPELLSIFNKSIELITKKKQQHILQKWISLKHKSVTDYTLALQIFTLVEDITEKIATDEKIEAQRKKLIHSAKLASIGEMAAGVGHGNSEFYMMDADL
jgi:C4-dicarboxylate-specific signal transduction histidine kinase